MRKPAVKQVRLVEQWKEVPEGTPVTLRKDDGTVLKTKTRSIPWMLCGTAVIMVEGIAGGYMLERIRKI